MAEITIQEAAEFANRAKERRLAGVTLGAPSPEKVAEVERLKAEIAEEKAIQAEEIARINRPRYIAPNDGIGVTVPIAKVVWDATKAPEGFRLIKGGARVVKDSKGNPQLIMGKTAKENDRGAPKPDCAHVFWCSATWELGELRNLPVSKAFLAAREVVANGGMAAVESRGRSVWPGFKRYSGFKRDKSSGRPPYAASPARGRRTDWRCTRIWWGRSGNGRHRSRA